MKINGNEVRTGNILEYQGRLMRATKVHIVQMGNWRSYLQVELKDIRDGTKLNERIRPADVVERVQLDEKEYQFLYKEGSQYTFMDNETFDQLTLSKEWVGDQMLYMKENEEAQLIMYEGKPISLELPEMVELVVKETEPSVKGATAAAQYKPAILETGLKVTVPPFISIGEKLQIDTRTGEYLSRAK